MNELHKISVAMCTYNGSRYLLDQLNSIANQTLLPHEIVICDDCSTDNTVDILKEFREHTKIDVRIFSNDVNLGSSRNFEKAISLCSGDIIALADQDDIWNPEKIEKLVDALSEKNNCALVFSDAEVVDENIQDLGYRLWESGNVQFGERLKSRFIKHGALDVLIRRYIVTGATMAFRGNLKNLVLPIADSWVHDGWIAFILAAIGKEAVFVEEPLIQYRQHTAQQIGAEKPARERGFILSVYDFIEVRFSAWKTGQQKPSPVFDCRYLEDAKRALLENCTIQEEIQKSGVNLEKIIKLINGKIIHQKKRQEILAKPRIARIWPVFLELLKGNYHKYSYNVVMQCGKDILN